MARYLPHPVLSLTIIIVWVMLANEASAGNLLLGAILGFLIPLSTARFWSERLRIKAPFAIVEYGLLVIWDIIVSNVQVARLILFRRGESLRSIYITVPLDLTTPTAITALAGTITMTPGTVSADLSADGKALLVHCLETDDPSGTVAGIKSRYEQRLKRIFE
ncbi:Na+/H+ antiporter subunit E [Pseudochelatococcus sp. B33]